MKKKSKIATKPSTRAQKQNDITALMLRDHKPLKRLIKVLKKPDGELKKLQSAFAEFAPLLEAHAVPEQESLYTRMEKDQEEEIRVDGFEGFTEHGLADELAKKIKMLRNDDDWKAHVKVLAELVEHHIEEEEEDMIPELRKDFDEETRIEIGEEYLSRRARFDVPTAKAA